MGKATRVRAMASSEWRRLRKASGRKRALKSLRSEGITGKGNAGAGEGAMSLTDAFEERKTEAQL